MADANRCYNRAMEREELMRVKKNALTAARNAAVRIKISGDRARVIFDAAWEVIETELRRERSEELIARDVYKGPRLGDPRRVEP